MNSYELSRKWFDFCFDNPEKITTNHTALYFFIIEHCNRLGWKPKFGLPSQMAMDAIGIKNWRTYSKALNELIDFGFIKCIQKSKNQYSATVIAIVKNTKATTKALDKAMQSHDTKQSKSIAHVVKPNNLITNKPNNTDQIEALYNLYPSKTIRDGKTCQTKSKEKNKKKLSILLSKKEHTFESLKKTIESELNGKKIVNGVYEYLKNLEVFLGNLPDIDSVDIDPNKLDDDYIYFQWMDDATVIARRVLKKDSEQMFKNQLKGGLTPIILTSIKKKTTTWKQ